MTAKVIPFPGPAGVNLAEVENRIRTCIVALTDDADMVEQVTGRMMAFIENYTCKTFEPCFNLPLRPLPEAETRAFMMALEDGMDAVAAQVCDMVNKIVMERLFLEVEIYEATRGLGNTGGLGKVPAVLALLPDGYREEINYLAAQLKDPDLKTHEKYMLNKLLAAVLAAKSNGAGQSLQV